MGPAALRLWLKRLLWAASVLGLLCLLMWGVVRLWGASWVAAPLTRYLGRPVALDVVDWRPWTLRVEVRGLEIAGRVPGQPLLRVERIALGLALESLWRRHAVVREMLIDRPQLTLSRTGAGHYDVDDLIALATKPSANQPKPWSLHNVRLTGGGIDFHDQPLDVVHRVRALRLDLPFLSSEASDVEVVTRPHLSFELNGDAYDLQTQSTPFAPSRHTHLQLDVPHLDLRAYRAYWPASLPVQPEAGVAQISLGLAFERMPAPTLRLQGALKLQDMYWRSVGAGMPPTDVRWSSLSLQLDEAEPLAGLWKVSELRLQDLGVWSSQQPSTPPKPALAVVQQLTLTGLQVDAARQHVQSESLEILAPQVRISRDARGRWIWDAQASGRSAQPVQSAKASSSPPWSWSLGALNVDEGQMTWRDEATVRPVSLQWSQWKLRVEGLDSTQLTNIPVQLSWRWDARDARVNAPAGLVDYQGRVRVSPDGAQMGLQGQLTVQQLPLHAIEPYADRWLQAQLLRGWLQYKGQLEAALQPQGPRLQMAGNLSLNGVRLRMPDADQDVLRWDALQLRGLGVQIDQGQLRQLTVNETSLVDYAVQAQLSAQGRLNLLDLIRQPAASEASVTTAPRQSAAATPVAQPLIRLGPTSLVQGRVFFRDRYVKPNYSVDLFELTGSISALSNQIVPGGASPAPADVLLRGRGEGASDLEIRGQVQPLARPVVLDLRAQLHGLDLSPLTGYSTRFTGYGIERGKLSLDANYRIDARGQLQASNRIVLDQLVFGERQEAEGVPNWPVKLAVSLLADRNGVVDIQLPIHGSINDPEFSVGGILVRLLFNLIAKAVTSPLSMIAAAFGQGEELTQVVFEPGHVDLSPAGQAALDKLAAWMRERGQWVLVVQGQADAAKEQTAYRRVQLQQMVQAQKEGRRASDAQAESQPVTEQEWPGLLKQVYLRAKISKPRNLIGMVRDLPVQDMESLLLASIPVDDAAMQALAQSRARAVRDALVSRGISADQVFLATPKERVAEEGWSPRVQLQLKPR